MATVTARSSINSSTRALLLASAAAAVAVTLPSVHCEAQNDNNANDRITETEVRQAIHDVWIRVDENLHRLDASSLQGQSLPRIAEPVLEFSEAQDQVIVTFEVPQQLNIHGAASLLRKLLSSPQLYATGKENQGGRGGAAGASSSETSSSGPKGIARRLRRRSSPEDSVVIDILQPYNQEEPARFEFRGTCTRANLKLLEAAMLHAAQPADSCNSPSQRQKSRHIPGWFGNVGSALDDQIESGLEEFFEPLREMMKDFERLHGEHPHDWSGDGAPRGHRDGFPPFHFPPGKRFDYPDIDGHGERPLPSSPATAADRALQEAMRKLREMGCQIFLPHSTDAAEGTDTQKKESDIKRRKTSVVDWGPLAGYNEQKRAIEDCLLLPLVRPEVYDKVALGTREKFAPNRPRAVLFVGPPGTGKTSSARVIASQAAVPLVYIPLESLGSKWYGESEKKLAEALAAADSLPEGCIIFLDELDALATSRSGDMHEATRRLLGVLLRHMDGFDTSKRSVIVGATNRAQDLDNALLSRFSAVVEFGLPDETCRRDILKTYAKNLKDVELIAVAAATPGMAGRDLRDICEQAERKWAAKIIRGQASEGSYPPVKEYLVAANARLGEMAHAVGNGSGSGSNNLLGRPFKLKSMP
jgi:hypothetical protein